MFYKSCWRHISQQWMIICVWIGVIPTLPKPLSLAYNEAICFIEVSKIHITWIRIVFHCTWLTCSISAAIVFGLPHMPVRSPQNLHFLSVAKLIYRIKVSHVEYIHYWTQNHCTRAVKELVKGMEDDEEGTSSSLSPEVGSVVWMQLMRFAKRNGSTAAQGQTDARRVFLRSRRWEKCTWHVFVCHALMEWQLLRQLQPDQLAKSITIVKRLFELGLEKAHVLTSPGYITTYANWLVSALPHLHCFLF